MIKPGDVKPKLRKVDESRIDRALREHGRSGDFPCRIATSLIDDPAMVEQAYSLAGWKVRYVFDPRDGDYLEFDR